MAKSKKQVYFNVDLNEVAKRVIGRAVGELTDIQWYRGVGPVQAASCSGGMLVFRVPYFGDKGFREPSGERPTVPK